MTSHTSFRPFRGRGTQRTFRQISKEVGDATFLDSGFRRNDEIAPVAPILPLC